MKFESYYVKEVVEDNDFKMVILEGSDDRYVILQGDKIIAFLDGAPPYTDILFIEDSYTANEILDIFVKLYWKRVIEKDYTEEELERIKGWLSEIKNYKFNLVKV